LVGADGIEPPTAGV